MNEGCRERFASTMDQSLDRKRLATGALRYIQPGKPQQNAFIERFNRTYRHEVLDYYLFDNLQQARLISQGWMRLYNEERPHRALGKMPPLRYAQQLAIPDISSYPLST